MTNAGVGGYPSTPKAAAQGPRIIVPPGALFAATGVATWPANNQIILMRFTVPYTKSYRYVNLQVGTSSGNIQIAISSVSLTVAGSASFTRIVDTGVIACPTGSTAYQFDLGETTLTAGGDYALSLWCDNTTATFMTTGGAGLAASRLLFGNSSLTAGLPAGSTTIIANTRWVSGMCLEASS